MGHLMKSVGSAVALAIAIVLVPAMAATNTFEVPAEIMNEINVTSDSSRGWIPTSDQRQSAIKAVQVFLDAVDGGHYDEAYRLLADANKRDQTFTQFAQDKQKFNALAGPVKFWKVLKVTWTKDPAKAPFPGVYAAVDLAAQFANVDRDCGYIVVYQPPAGGGYTVMRTENNYLDNATARKIAIGKPAGYVESVWAQVSRNCPGYIPPLPEASVSTIGYPTVAAALMDLRSRPGIVFTTVNGWTIATDEAAYTVWSFAPPSYPAYPAVVKRWVVSQGAGSMLHMDVQCEASKAACDDLVRTFQKMNAPFGDH